MPRYIVQRTFPEGLRIPADAGLADLCRGVIQRNAQQDVTWIGSFVSEDKTRTFCVCDAPSPEAIRKTALRNALALAARRRAATAAARAMHADHTVSPAAGPGRAAPPRAWVSFSRIVDVPFGTCVAALESGPLTGPDGARPGGPPLVYGPVEHDPDSGTCRVQVRLARGPLRPALPMRLQADQWSCSPPRTALELIPCARVRPSAAYFRAGHRLLDQLARSLTQPRPAPSRTVQHQPTAGQEHDMPQFMDFHEDLKLPSEALAQIADDTRHGRADQFGVRQVELYHNPDGRVYCLLEGPDEDAIRRHHAALGVPCGDVHQVDSLN